ncbi:sigma-70 family RNA polymerase sigma factor [Streptomyces brasiliscabiei]|uniref:sigma-70 family RNA polymerase sigma factor n=1 Tax=Streptomyces brasiliscabiei TaxID=2736302 RepID=UPI001C10E05A|nr:sigma-70 family RNA polymerase sigma factor [Streptomyces brasiliscabiei]
MTDGLSGSATAAYTRIYEEQHPRLVAYARSLTRNSWTAEDLVAEAHFRVWRRLSGGHEIDNVPAYLMTTVRHLATTASTTATRETPLDPTAPERAEAEIRVVGPRSADASDPAEQVSSVDLLVRVLGQLPERWVQALWLAEAEGEPLETVGRRIGAKQGATAVLLHRAREGMRQAFLREQPGAPIDPACQVRWGRMPAYVRGTATSRQSAQLLGHVDACDDCRARLSVLMRTNDRLPALVGPALLVFVVGGGGGKLLLSLTAGSTGTAAVLGGAGGAGGVGGAGGQLLHAVRQAVGGGAGGVKVPTVAAVGAATAAAAVVAGIVLGPLDSGTAPARREPVAQAPGPRMPEARSPEVVERRNAVTDAVVSPRGAVPSDPVVVRVGDDGGRGAGGSGSDDSDSGGGDPQRPEVTVPEGPDAEVPGTGPVVEEPAVEEPGVEEPGGEEPGGGYPGAEQPPAEEPVAEEPVAEEPVAEGPGSGEPSVPEEGPAEAPPVQEEPPVEEPPVEEGPAEAPPAEEPPVEAPPVEAPPVEEPPVEAPPVEEPPVEAPPVEEPPAPGPPEVVEPAPEVPVPPVEPSPEVPGDGGVGGPGGDC